MSIVERDAREKEVCKECWTDWDSSSLNRILNDIKASIQSKYCKTKKKKELTWTPAYTNMSKENVFDNCQNEVNMNVD